jgi:hypothetical protein
MLFEGVILITFGIINHGVVKGQNIRIFGKESGGGVS